MTWSPLFSVVTPAPISTTIPAPSCPRIAGKSPSGSAPERVNSSVWQMPVALTSTSTSPAFGPSSRTVSIVSGAPALCATAARTSIVPPFSNLTQFSQPARGRFADFGVHLHICPARRLEHMKRMVGALDPVHRPLRFYFAKSLLHQRALAQRIPGAVEAEHRTSDLRQMRIAQLLRLARRMERVGGEQQPGARKALGREHRGRPPPHGSASDDETLVFEILFFRLFLY